MKTDALTMRQQEALAQYSKLRQQKASIIKLGRPCSSFLNRQIWRSQPEMASVLLLHSVLCMGEALSASRGRQASNIAFQHLV
jgi:hypothetical protein